eukprot:scaffold207207_cov35-Tisochrysis_lutea.AAC.2
MCKTSNAAAPLESGCQSASAVHSPHCCPLARFATQKDGDDCRAPPTIHSWSAHAAQKRTAALRTKLRYAMRASPWHEAQT